VFSILILLHKMRTSSVQSSYKLVFGAFPDNFC
jgi:ER lumen protein retaining receptor